MMEFFYAFIGGHWHNLVRPWCNFHVCMLSLCNKHFVMLFTLFYAYFDLQYIMLYVSLLLEWMINDTHFYISIVIFQHRCKGLVWACSWKPLSNLVWMWYSILMFRLHVHYTQIYSTNILCPTIVQLYMPINIKTSH